MMLKDWDRLEIMRSTRKNIDGFQDGRVWNEVDEMLRLVAPPRKTEAEA